MTHSQPSWAAVTRHGVPDFVVVRRPLPASAAWGEQVPVNTPVPESLRSNVRLLRQLYGQRLVAPVKEDAGDTGKRHSQFGHPNPHPQPSAPTAPLPPSTYNLALEGAKKVMNNRGVPGKRGLN